MKAPVALTVKVIGSSSAMVSAGPMPGSTPIAVPRKQPSSAQPRLVSDNAWLKPRARPEMASMPNLPWRVRRVASWRRPEHQPLDDARADVHPEQLHEERIGTERDDEG